MTIQKRRVFIECGGDEIDLGSLEGIKSLHDPEIIADSLGISLRAIALDFLEEIEFESDDNSINLRLFIR